MNQTSMYFHSYSFTCLIEAFSALGVAALTCELVTKKAPRQPETTELPGNVISRFK